MLEFAVLCSEMDVDKNGKLSLEEMMNGCDKSDAMAKLMHLLDLRREDLATVFRVVDDENKGEVSYLQLCQLLASFLDRDPVIVQSLIKYSVADLRKLVQHEVVDLLRQQQDQLKEQTNMIASLREEMQLIREKSRGSIHSSKEATDEAFDAAAGRLLSSVAQERPSAALVLATHNRCSLNQAVAKMEQLGLARDHPRVHFAQIFGMVDNLTFSLGLAGYNASKLLVFGEVKEVLPWLVIRAQKGGGFFFFVCVCVCGVLQNRDLDLQKRWAFLVALQKPRQTR
ncbi:unnamed protein product [Effrenium voratum]|nr:unnamed protein product [Effrenium voratum]